MARPRRRSPRPSAPTSISADGATCGAGHLDPLKFAQGLARAAAEAGARIFEDSRATKVTGWPRRAGSRLRAPIGATLRADIVILAGNGYLDGIDAEVEARVMPIDNYILATAPIGAGRPGGLIPGGEAVSDTRFVVYYFRPTGRRPAGLRRRRDLFAAAAARHRRPSCAGISPASTRSSPTRASTMPGAATLAITLQRLPFIRRVRPGVYAAAGYSGQGVALAPFAGKILADAIAGDPAASIASPPFPVRPFPAASCSASRRSSPA